MAEDFTQRRRYPRAPVSLVVDYRLTEDSSENQLNGKITVLGAGGCFVQTKTPFVRGTTLRVSFVIGQETFDLQAEVRCQVQYSWTSKQVQYPGMGLAFLNLTPPQQTLIGDHVNQILAADKS